MKKISVTLIFLVMLGIASNLSVVHAELITNGGFETGSLAPWTVTGADNFGFSLYTPHSGSYLFWGFDNYGFATLSQTISTTAGYTYDFSFWSETNYDGASNILRYSLDGGPIITATRTTTWALTSDSFIASSSSAVIDFYFETDSGTGTWHIDDVSVTASAVPEPATMLLLGSGLMGLAGFRKRFRKS